MSDLEETLRAARDEFEPSQSDRARVKQRLLAKAAGAGLIASLAAKGSAGATIATTSVAAPSLPILSKLFFGSMIVTFAGAGAVVAVTRNVATNAGEHPAAAAPLTASPKPISNSAPHVAPNEPTAPVPPEAATRAATHPPSSKAAPALEPPANPEAELEAELALLRDAKLAATHGDTERAQRVLDALDRRHPRGVLLEERSALRAMTDCDAGRGTTRAADFLRRNSASVYASKVRRTCGLEATETGKK
jgi:hypothetical protein